MTDKITKPLSPMIEWGRKPYLVAPEQVGYDQESDYQAMMRSTWHKAQDNNYIIVQSVLKKPYLSRNYQNMEQMGDILTGIDKRFGWEWATYPDNRLFSPIPSSPTLMKKEEEKEYYEQYPEPLFWVGWTPHTPQYYAKSTSDLNFSEVDYSSITNIAYSSYLYDGNAASPPYWLKLIWADGYTLYECDVGGSSFTICILKDSNGDNYYTKKSFPTTSYEYGGITYYYAEIGGKTVAGIYRTST